MSFFLGGMYHSVQTFNAVSNRACSSLLMLACIGILIPSAASKMVDDPDARADWVLDVSRGTAVVMLAMWVTVTAGSSYGSGGSGFRGCRTLLRCAEDGAAVASVAMHVMHWCGEGTQCGTDLAAHRCTHSTRIPARQHLAAHAHMRTRMRI